MKRLIFWLLFGLSALIYFRCSPPQKTVAESLTSARYADGLYISWKEHIVDDEKTGGVPIRGADGLKLADLDQDGYLDIVSVHEDSNHVRVAFGSRDPDEWHLMTLAEGKEASDAEDVDVGDVNSDGRPDLIIACEGGHLLYLQNPGDRVREKQWERIIPKIASSRGSFIRASFADLNMDGKVEVVAVNKGTDPADEGVSSLKSKTAISLFEISGNPLEDSSWKEHILSKVRVPINAEPVDLDGDGDLDIVAGSRGESRIFWLENLSGEINEFKPHEIHMDIKSISLESGKVHITGFSMMFHDFSGDSRLDILLAEMPIETDMGRTRAEWENPGLSLYWLEQPQRNEELWKSHRIGWIAPDIPIGLVIVDINNDGYRDVMTGGYSRGPRLDDGDQMTATDPLSRLAWFENPGVKTSPWIRHDISRRKRGMYDKFIPIDMDQDGDMDFVSTRGNSGRFDGVFWLEQVHTTKPVPAFQPARVSESQHMPLPFDSSQL